MSDFSSHFNDYLDGYRHSNNHYWQSVIPPSTAVPAPNHPPARQWQVRPYFCERLAQTCERALGGTVTALHFPGSEERDVCHVTWADGRTAIACLRAEAGRARLEERVLHYLNTQAVAVPKVLHCNGILLIQEALHGERLSQRLAHATPSAQQQLLSKALESLIEIQQAGSHLGLDQAVPVLGAEAAWVNRHVRQLDKIAAYLAIPLPELPRADIHDVLTLLQPRFIKWDARPGNAMLSPTGQVYWFDWENCGARNRLDDFIWLLCDESVPFNPQIETALWEAYLPQFADGMTLDMAYGYARVAAVLHCAARLGLILYKKDAEDWWDGAEILDYDYVGVTLAQAQYLCQRAAYWAAREPLLTNLAEWFSATRDKLEDFENDIPF